MFHPKDFLLSKVDLLVDHKAEVDARDSDGESMEFLFDITHCVYR